MSGSVYKRCGCTEVVDGKRRQLGHRCPQLRRKDGTLNPRHGTWTLSTSVRGTGGKRQQVVRGGFASEKEARRELERVSDKARRGVSVNRITMQQYLSGWLAGKSDIRPSTLRAYTAHASKYLLPQLGHLLLDDLRVAHVAEMLAKVHASDATRQRVRATLRSALSDAVREGLVMVNVATLVKLPAGRRPKALVWTPERVQRWQQAGEVPSPVMVWTPGQLGAFLDRSSADRLYALWHLISHRGLRRGEAAGLRWEDIDLDAGQATIRRQRVQLGWEVLEGDPKSEAGGRTIALDAGTVAALRTHRREQREERMAWGPSAYVDSSVVFTREDGEPLHPAIITDRFHRLTTTAGLPPLRLHDLRHGAASLMLAAGVSMKVVQETLGHSSVVLTSDTYSSVYPQVASAAAEAAAAMVPRALG